MSHLLCILEDIHKPQTIYKKVAHKGINLKIIQYGQGQQFLASAETEK